MDRSIDNQLVHLKNYIQSMGKNVEVALTVCTQGFQSKQPDAFAQVHELENEINDLQLKVDKTCTTILAQQGPVARDLRLILSIIRMNADLERMGDQCANIAYLARDILKRDSTVSFDDINDMIKVVCSMVKLSLNCFVALDSHLAKQVLEMDDEVDQFKSSIRKKNIINIQNNVQMTETYLDMILISRNLERLGDHATNIAEDVIFALSGQDIRHGQVE